MRFQYVGEKEEMTVFGYGFSNGAVADVTEPEYIRRLSGNTHFVQVDGEPKKKPGRPKKVTEEP